MRRTAHRLTLCVVICGLFTATAPASDAPPLVATFSIVAYDPATGDLGVAVASKFFGVGSVVPWAKAGVGAVATQSFANVRAGPAGLLLLEKGDSPEETVKALLAADPLRDLRQIAVIDAQGHTAAHTGKECRAWAGHRCNENFSVQGNLLAGEAVIEAMETAFVKSREEIGSELGDWLMAALAAGQGAGGDKRGRQSAALLVVRKHSGGFGANDRFIDLRVEDHTDPVDELARLLEIHKQFFAAEHRAVPERK